MPSIIMEVERNAEKRGISIGEKRGRQGLLEELAAAGIEIPESFFKENNDPSKEMEKSGADKMSAPLSHCNYFTFTDFTSEYAPCLLPLTAQTLT